LRRKTPRSSASISTMKVRKAIQAQIGSSMAE
jgi:hypothetical protein